MSLPMPLDGSTLDLAVAGHNLEPCTFGEVFGQQLTLLVFLRHHG